MLNASSSPGEDVRPLRNAGERIVDIAGGTRGEICDIVGAIGGGI